MPSLKLDLHRVTSATGTVKSNKWRDIRVISVLNVRLAGVQYNQRQGRGP